MALRLVCERESEIEAFKPTEYWGVQALLKTPTGDLFQVQQPCAVDCSIEKQNSLATNKLPLSPCHMIQSLWLVSF